MTRLALRAVFYLGLALLVLLVLLISNSMGSGKPPYVKAKNIVQLALSKCWSEMGDNPWSVPGSPHVVHESDPTVEEYIDCVIYKLRGWEVLEPGTEFENGADAENQN